MSGNERIFASGSLSAALNKEDSKKILLHE